MIRRNYKTYRIKVRQTLVDKTKEQYSIIGKNKIIVVENNRPLWLARQVRHRMEWKHVSGDLAYMSDFEEITSKIEDHIKAMRQKGLSSSGTDIAIIFEYGGKTYHGRFSSVSGSSNVSQHHWHLYIDNFYQGQLAYSSQRNEWRYTSNSGKFDELSDYFASFIAKHLANS